MRKKLVALGIILLILIAGINVTKTIIQDNQAVDAFLLHVTMQGEYKIGDGEWNPIVPGEHISASKGDVTLRGTLHMAFPNGEIVAPVSQNANVVFLLNHLGGSVNLEGQEPYVFDSENARIGNGTCGEYWFIYGYEGTESEIVEIHLTNPHIYGNEFAVDDFLNSMRMYENGYFERMMAEKTEGQKIMGYCIFIVAIIIIGIALFSTLIRLDVSKIIWFAGLTILFAGIYFIAEASNTFIGKMHISMKTTLVVLSIMLYGFFMEAFTSLCFVKPLKKIGHSTVAVMGGCTGLLLTYALVSNVKLFDVFAIWVVLQIISAIIMLVISCRNLKYVEGLLRLSQIVFIISLISMIVDLVATRFGWWHGAKLATVVFIVQFVAALFAVLRVLPESIRAALQEKEMQAELEKSKTTVMLSQIQPHFLYNSLGAIRELCRQDPEEARSALGTFITYLRGNMDSIQREHTIHFSKELDHISAYLQLERLRFGEDLNVIFDIQEKDFFIPSLTIQPLVENAVKHGVCSREEGGTVTLHTHREDNVVVVKVQDDGIGFNMNNLDKVEHVGLKNVRKRLKYIVNGTLEIESKENVGTIATITINDRKD